MRTKKKNTPKAAEIVYFGESGTLYTQNDYDYYLKLMQQSGSPILPLEAYFEALERDTLKQRGQYGL